MNEQSIRQNVARKLAAYRKRAGLTQVELAEKLNYSDKSVSKWERGEGLPDLMVLCALSELYGVPVDEFLRDGALRKPIQTIKQRRVFIVLLSAGLVWLVATIAFFALTLAHVPDAWFCFIAAIPVSAIVMVVFAHLWGNTLLQFLSVSLLVWALAVLVYLAFRCFFPVEGAALVFTIAAVSQVLVLLWYAFQHIRKRSIHIRGTLEKWTKDLGKKSEG